MIEEVERKHHRGGKEGGRRCYGDERLLNLTFYDIRLARKR